MTSSEPIGPGREPASDSGHDSGGDQRDGPDPGLPSGSLLDGVAEVGCELLEVARAGVWILEEAGARLRRVHLYDHTTGSHRSVPGLLERSRFPEYFTAVEAADGALAVSDAASDDRLGDLYEVYARPLGIRAWIDAPVPSSEGIAGMLRLEGTGRPREWSERERRVARALGALLARSDALSPSSADGEGTGHGSTGRSVAAVGVERSPGEELFDRLPTGLVLTDGDGRIVRCNPAFAELLGHDSPSALVGRPIGHFHASEADRRQLSAEVARQGRVTSRGYEARGRDGSRLWLLESAVRLEPEGDDAGGQVGEGFVLSAVTDATRLKRRQARLEDQAHRDALTGLANRRFLHETMLQTLALAERHGRQLAVAYLDLSDFKSVNDRFGHEVGDEVLRVAGQRIVEGVRDSDVVARIGGDEFVILFAEVDGAEGARDVSCRVLERFRTPVRVQDLELRLSADVGIALYPDHGREAAQLLRNADVAMYRAKRMDGEHIRTYREEAGTPLSAGSDGGRRPEGEEAAPAPGARPADREASAAPVRTPVSEEGVREALAGGRLALHYQPVYRLSTGETVGAEGLLRWNHPQSGLLPAAEFVPLVEDPELIGDLDRWAIEAAVRQLARWRDEPAPSFVSVNVDPRSLDRLPLFLDGLFRRVEVDPSRLILEIVIDSESPDVGGLAEKLAFLEGTGCRIALDLGSDPERLAPFLRGVAADLVKLETASVTSGPGAPISELFVNGAGGGKAELLVKRVETEEQYRAVRDRAATMGQGYYWSGAVPAEDFRVA